LLATPHEILAGELQVTDLFSYTFVVIQSDFLMAHNLVLTKGGIHFS